MSLPTTTREYRLPKADGLDNLTLTQSNLAPLGPADVLVKTHAVSLQYTDISIACSTDDVSPTPNVVPCSDMAGEVIAVGSNVTTFKVGDRVCANRCLDHVDGDVSFESMCSASGFVIDGVLTEYRSFPQHSLVNIPEHLTYEEAAGLPCAAVTAWNCLFGPKPIIPGDWVLLLGTSGVSLFALQFAVLSGANVIITSSDDAKLATCKKLGAHSTINYKTNPDWDVEVKKITGGLGADHILEMGGPGTLKKSISSIRISGWIHVVGFLNNATDDVNVTRQLIGKSCILRGVFIGSVRNFKDMNRFISSKQIRPIVDKVFSFEESLDAYKYLQKQVHFGKVIVKVSKD